MRVKRSYLIAGGVFGLLVLYFVVRSVLTPHEKDVQASTPKNAQEQATLVQVALTPETLRPYAVTVRARTEATRSVEVRAATAGIVAATPVPEGSFVRQGQVLCRLAVDARQASLDQARAGQRSSELQYQASRQLQEKGFRSETQVLAAKANLDQAAAMSRSAEVALDQVNVRAPFNGVFDNRATEVGGYLSPGQACGTVIELDPLLVVGDVSETDAARMHVGAQASAKLPATGQTVTGHVRFVSREADPATRTYRIEVTSRNPSAVIRAGLSAEMHVQAGSGPAHFIPISALVLDAAGRQGVRWVDPGDKVEFTPVQVIEETPQGVWISGLTGAVKIITVGQSYVAEGQKVRVALR
jgi:multidrug efflux system membrane fusion protein